MKYTWWALSGPVVPLAEASAELIDRRAAPHQYRFFAVAGTPYIPDPLVPSFSNQTTPASFHPESRAHFLQGDRWVKNSQPPPPSNHLATAATGAGEQLAHDANGNALSMDASGRRVPRLPFLELGEARFISGFLGSYDDVKTIEDLGFKNHHECVKHSSTSSPPMLKPATWSERRQP